MWVSFWLTARLVSRALNESCEYAFSGIYTVEHVHMLWIGEAVHA